MQTRFTRRASLVITAGSLCAASGAARAAEIIDAFWLDPVSESWYAPSRWSTGFTPQNTPKASYAVRIDATGAPYIIQLDSGPFPVIHSLLLDSADATLDATRNMTVTNGVEVRAGVLRLGTGARLTTSHTNLTGGSLILAGGFLSGGQIIENASSGFSVDTVAGGFADGATIRGGAFETGFTTGSLRVLNAGLTLDGASHTQGRIDLNGSDATLTLRNGATIGGVVAALGTNSRVVLENSLDLRDGAALDFSSVAAGARSIALGAGVTLSADDPGSLLAGQATVTGSGPGSALVNRGGLSLVNGSLFTVASSVDRFENRADLSIQSGTLTVDAQQAVNTHTMTALSGGAIRIINPAFSNEGTIRVQGGSATISGNWSNTGVIDFHSGTGSLGGDWTNENLITVDGGSATLTGSWINNGVILHSAGAMRWNGQYSTTGIGEYVRTGGTLTALGVWDSTGAVTDLSAYGPTLSLGAVLRGGEFVSTGDTQITITDRSLDDTRIAASLLNTGAAGVTVNVWNGPTITGEMRMPGGTLLARNDQTIDALHMRTGVFNNGSTTTTATRINPNGFHLALGEGVVIDAQNTINFQGLSSGQQLGSVDFSGVLNAAGLVSLSSLDHFANHGSITADRFTLMSSTQSFANTGTITVTGNSFSLRNEWSNEGQIVLNPNITTTFRGVFSAESLRNIHMNGATGSITDAEINLGPEGMTLDQSWQYGLFRLATLRDGRLGVAGNLANFLTTDSNNHMTLRDVALTSDVDFGRQGSTPELRVRGEVDLGANTLRLLQSSTVDLLDATFRNGSVVFQSGSPVVFNGELRFASDVDAIILGASLRGGSSNSPNTAMLINEGHLTLRGPNALDGFTSSGYAVHNTGVIEVQSPSTVYLGSRGVRNDGLIQVTGGTLAISEPVTGSGILQVSEGTLALRNFASFPDLSWVTLSPSATLRFDEAAIDLSGETVDLAQFGARVVFQSGAISNGAVHIGPAGMEVRSFHQIGVAMSGGDLHASGGTIRLNPGFSLTGGDIRLLSNTVMTSAISDFALETHSIFGGQNSLQLNVTRPGGGEAPTFTIGAGRTLEAAGISLRPSTQAGVPLEIINDGVVRVVGLANVPGFESFLIGGGSSNNRFQNNGLLDITSGALFEVLNAADSLGNFDGTTLTGGRWRVESGGVVLLYDAAIRVNEADITLEGAASNFAALQSIHTNRGSLRLLSRRSLILGQAFTNDGYLWIDQGRVTAHGLTITQDATTEFTLAPGVAGNGQGTINSSGAVELAGHLVITLSPSLPLAWGDIFELIRAPSISGDFNSFTLPTLADTLVWHTSIVDGSYYLGVRDSADLNADGVVNFADMNILLANFGLSGSGVLGDIDSNGLVDFSDLNTLLVRFGASAPRAVPAPGVGVLFAVVAFASRRGRRETGPVLTCST